MSYDPTDGCPVCGTVTLAHAPDRTYLADAPTFAWTVEGEIVSGTLDRYAKDLEEAHYVGVTVGDKVWDGRQMLPVTIEHESTSEDDQGYPDYSYSKVVVRASSRRRKADGTRRQGRVLATATMKIDLRS
jgi:hypothetical protein